MELPLNLHTQYITNDKNERVSVIIPINEFEKMKKLYHIKIY